MLSSRTFLRWRQAAGQTLPSNVSVTIPFRRAGIGLNAGGVSFTLAVAILVYLAIRYSLNIGYLLLFNITLLMVVSGAWGAHILSRLTLALEHMEPICAGEAGTLRLNLNAASRVSGLEILLFTGEEMELYPVDVRPGTGDILNLTLPRLKRGVYEMPTLLIQTRRPFGIWRIYVNWTPPGAIYVYPAPEANPPEPHANDDTEARKRRTDSDEIQGLKPYVAGDRPKTISWKAFAKTDGRVLATRDMGALRGQGPTSLQLHEADNGRGTEAALARLAAWVNKANLTGRSFELVLPGVKSRQGSGEAHHKWCLERLAAYTDGSCQ